MSADTSFLQRWRLTLAYDGSPFQGWQVQGNRPTIQRALGDACQEICGVDTLPEGSGRTDAGVHARGQVAHIDLPPRDPWQLREGLNAVLPASVRVLQAEPVAADFHARFHAIGKEYRYHAWCGAVPYPWLLPYRWVHRRLPDASAMREAAAQLVGTHDFAPFAAKRGDGTGEDHTLRTLYRLELLVNGPEWVVVAHGDGFLYKMVRSLVGFLFRVGEGGLRPEDANRLLASGVRTQEVPTAPPQGLFLWRVDYQK